MGQSPIYGLPWPEPSDPADIPAAMQATALETEEIIGELMTSQTAVYPLGQLPRAAAVHTLALFEAATGKWWLGQYNPARGAAGAWDVFGGEPVAAQATPGNLVAATGWRKPTGSPAVTIPFTGLYEWLVSQAMTYTVTENTGGMGIAPTSVAANGNPTLNVLNGGPASQRLTQIIPDLPVQATAGQIWDVRFNSSASAGMNFGAIGHLRARPVWVEGVV